MGTVQYEEREQEKVNVDMEGPDSEKGHGS